MQSKRKGLNTQRRFYQLKRTFSDRQHNLNRRPLRVGERHIISFEFPLQKGSQSEPRENLASGKRMFQNNLNSNVFLKLP